MELISLVSGSSGNASIVSDGHSTILVDCGMSGKALVNALSNCGKTIDDINAVMITHEHTDHIKGVGVIARKYGINIYGTEKTFRAMECGKINEDLLHPINPGREYVIGDIAIHPFSTSHDAVDPVGYSFTDGHSKVSVATDTGFLSEDMYQAIKGSNKILLESNHDVEMLKFGIYPPSLKRRILSDKGHLSNEACASIACRLVQDGTSSIALAHLSNENNLPDIAYLTSYNALDGIGVEVGQELRLTVASRYDITKV